MEMILKILDSAWDVFLDSAPFVTFGVVAAGLLRLFVPSDWLAGRLGGKGVGPILKAALLGAPLPL